MCSSDLFDRACRVRRRGVRWRSRAGWFASPISDFSALFACLRGCLLAIVFILWIRIALRDACTATSPAFGARRAVTQEGAVDMDSNASRAGEVERKVWRDSDFLLPGKLLKMSPLVDGQSAVSTLQKWRQRRRVAPGIRASGAKARIQLGARISEAKYRQLNLAAVLRGVTVQTLVEHAMQEFLTNHPELLHSGLAASERPAKPTPRKQR